MRAPLKLLLTIVMVISGDAYPLRDQCGPDGSDNDKIIDNKEISNQLEKIVPLMDTTMPIGYLGSVGIFGGTNPSKWPVLYAAKAALRVGADRVVVGCLPTEAAEIMSELPDIDIHPMATVNNSHLYALVLMQDVSLVGPGLSHNDQSIGVINELLSFGKEYNRTIILDLDSYFITQDLVNRISKYPQAGLVMSLGSSEFDKLYPMVKLSDEDCTNVNWDLLGPNVMLYRRGCTDIAISSDSSVAWSFRGGSSKKPSGLDSATSGALAVYLSWARKTMPDRPVTATSTAILAAAKLTRDCSAKAKSEQGKAAKGKAAKGKAAKGKVTTMNVIDQIVPHLYK